MTRRISFVLAALCVCVTTPAAQVKPPTAQVQVLVPVSGTWSADYENARQILTIEGTTKAPKPPDAEAIKTLWGADAPAFLKAVSQPGAFPLAIARDLKELTGGGLRVDFKLVGGASDQSAGIAFNIKPDGSYLFARYNTKDGNVAVWKFENGTRTVLTHGELHEQLPLGQWHTLEVTITRDTVRAVANGKLAVTHKLDAPTSGRVGVWTKADSVTTFRHFQFLGHGHTVK